MNIFFFFLAALGLHCSLQLAGISSFSTQAVLQQMGLVAPWLVGYLSSLTRDRTHVPCVGRQIFNHGSLSEHLFA